MKGEYEPDKFTENDVLQALEGANLKYKNHGSRYILAQCPLHEDKHESAQIYKDDWFVKCHAGCEGGRFHITKAFPALRDVGRSGASTVYQRPIKTKVDKAVKYKKVDLMEYWKSLPEIPRDHYFKNLPLDALDELGWKWDAVGSRYFIPYFSRSKTSIPFAQWRNLKGDVRFNFWKDTKPTMYGTWNLDPGSKIFLVEGSSDLAVLNYCNVPAIAAPSAASGELVKAMATWCRDNDILIVYAGDNDAAGQKLRDALDEVAPYRVRQPREPYKDWGDMFEAEGFESVTNYCFKELFPGQEVPYPEREPGYKAPEPEDELKKYGEPVTIEEAQQTFTLSKKEKTPLEKVQEVFPGATELKVVGGEKKQLETPPTLAF